MSWTIVKAVVGGASDRFRKRCQQASMVQAEQLNAILEQARPAPFAQAMGLGSVDGIQGFQQCCPIQDYEGFRPWVEEMLRDGVNRLTADAVVAFEETSGSRSAAKAIPITARGLEAIQRALFPWIDDLYHHYPEITQGCCYWAISPAGRSERTTEGGHPVGMPDDTRYFGTELARAFGGLSAVSQHIACTDDIDQWRIQALAQLIEARDLSFMSIWSPRFITALLDYCETEAGRVRENVVSIERRRAFDRALVQGRLQADLLWPQLALISSWTGASAAHHVAELQSRFPQAAIQGKGLMATEGVITIPMADLPAPVLAIESGFYEFLDDQGKCRLCHELEVGGEYQVLMSTYGGLFRYMIGDRVRVIGYEGEAPLLRLLGRGTVTSDLCGEKLTEAFIQEQLNGHAGFALLVPVPQKTPHYRLYLDPAEASPDEARAWARSLEARLCANPQYAYARRLGQLDPVRAWFLPQGNQRHERELVVANRTRLSVIKLPVLAPEADWIQRFSDARPVNAGQSGVA
mgnify:CR=1 FL=1